MPVPDQVRDDGSGIQNMLKLLDSGFLVDIKSATTGRVNPGKVKRKIWVK
jgi:hypothetical protein